MNYALLIEERSSSRAFQNKTVSDKILSELRAYHDTGCARLFPGIRTELLITGKDAREKLEKAAGYNEFLIGAPQYLILLSEDHDSAYLNAGFIMEDLMLKLSELGCGSCWLTFTDGEKIKAALSIQSEKRVAAVAAFGLPERARKKIHLNIISMSNVSISDKQHYFDPKKKLSELVSVDSYGNKTGLEDRLGFYDDVLFEAFHAVCNTPSYMNRQPFSFLLKDHRVYLLSEADAVTGPIDRDLNLGIALLHFGSVARSYIGSLRWDFESQLTGLPEGVTEIASCAI